MIATETEYSSTCARHELTAEDYPGEWARRIELYLDKEPRRAVFYGGLFGAFVLIVVIVMLIDVMR
ncbi:MAG: hypothetical protein ACRECX_10910 [Methyloceanibacter sp.]|uniref:hypothetical protein n=1 Tax=Methyloceanibacter sp. TaxID=1965321 RepID=UPI003D6D70D3